MDMRCANSCVLWAEIEQPEPLRGDASGSYLFISPRAGGPYRATIEAIYLLKPRSEIEKVAITNHLIGERILGIKVPLLTSGVVERILAGPLTLPVAERADRFLRLLSKETKLIGDVVAIKDDNHLVDSAFGWSGSMDGKEIRFLGRYMEQVGWFSSYTVSNSGILLTVSPAGFAHIDAISAKSSSSDQAFVAMWFDPSMSEPYDKGIAPGILASGYRPVRIDREQHNNKIDDELIAAIRRSCFVVADFTQGDSGARGGVYYEAGFAHGMGLPVIFTCRNDCMDHVHFDTRQYNHIVWRDPADLAEQLSNRISATIGDGPLRSAQT